MFGMRFRTGIIQIRQCKGDANTAIKGWIPLILHQLIDGVGIETECCHFDANFVYGCTSLTSDELFIEMKTFPLKFLTLRYTSNWNIMGYILLTEIRQASIEFEA